MQIEDRITKVTQVLPRKDGSEVRIVVQTVTGLGLTESTDVMVHRRETPDQNWNLLNNRPHPDWRDMSVEEYKQRGRSEVLQTVSPIEIMRLINALGKPMSYMDAFNKQLVQAH